MRGCFILKIHYTMVIFIYERRDTYLISRQPTQYQPPFFQFLVSFSFQFQNRFPSIALCDKIDIKRRGIFLRIFWYPNAYANAKKCDFDVQFQEMGSSLVSFQMIFEALQSLQVSCPGVEGPKNPGIQPIYKMLFLPHSFVLQLNSAPL